jgi:hypothetical protein
VPSPFADEQPRHGTERPLLDTARIVRDGVLLSVVASTYLLCLLRFNPRIFLGHFPKEIRDIVPPKSEKERRMSILLGLLIGASFASALLWRTQLWEVTPSGK